MKQSIDYRFTTTCLMMNEEVRSIMTKAPATASPNDTVEQVSATMLRKRLQQIPVVDDKNRLLGLITSYDLWRNCNDGNGNQVQIKQVMSTDVVKLAPKDKVGAAAELFMDKRFKTFPVVNLRNELKGVVTAFDIIRYSLKKEYRPEHILYQEIL